VDNIWVDAIKQVLPVTEYDEAILQCVEDIEAIQGISSQFEEYTLIFRFAPSVEDYFENECLNLRYSRKNSDGTIIADPDTISWHPECDPARRFAFDSSETSGTMDTAVPYLATSIFHLFIDPRADPNFGDTLCHGSLAKYAIEYVVQQQYVQVRTLFDAIHNVQRSRTYVAEKTPTSASAGDKS